MLSAYYEEMHPEYKYLVACYTKTKTFMEEMNTRAGKEEWAYDILLMDIYLPDGNGIKCGRILRDKGFAGVIIYKSSTEENCPDAFAVDAMQYLIKPVSEDKLFETMDQAIKKVMAEHESNYDNIDDSDTVIQTKKEISRKCAGHHHGQHGSVLQLRHRVCGDGRCRSRQRGEMRTLPYLPDLPWNLLLYLAGDYHCTGIGNISHHSA